MTNTPPDSSLRDRIYEVFYDLGVPSANTQGMEKSYVIDGADQILKAFGATLLQVIGDDEPEETRYGKRVALGKSVTAFQKHYRNGLRAEQRQRAIELTNTNLKRGITE